MNEIQLPIIQNDRGVFTLPVTLPLTLGEKINGKIQLPITLPFNFKEKISKVIVIPTREYVEKEGTKVLKVTTKETSWHFVGLIIDEFVVDKMQHGLTLIEDVKSRILTDISLINRNKIDIEWYGDSVPHIDVYRKMAIDDDYEFVSRHPWDVKHTEINLDNAEYDVKLLGINGTGESGVVSIGDSNYVDVLTNISISLNEKTYSFDINFVSKHTVNINL